MARVIIIINVFTGVIFVDKPKNVLSTKIDIVCKKIFNTKKVGHIGTLDPFASGILPIAINGATKLIRYFNWSQIKTYMFEVEFGKKTSTGDGTSAIIQNSNIIPTLTDIENTIPLFVGKHLQKPHIFSAVKINGKHSYDLARNGIIPELKPKEITIYSLQILAVLNNSTYKFKATVSTGTYIRSLSEDIAAKLHTIAYTKELRRASVGLFSFGIPFYILQNLLEYQRHAQDMSEHEIKQYLVENAMSHFIFSTNMERNVINYCKNTKYNTSYQQGIKKLLISKGVNYIGTNIYCSDLCQNVNSNYASQYIEPSTKNKKWCNSSDIYQSPTLPNIKNSIPLDIKSSAPHNIKRLVPHNIKGSSTNIINLGHFNIKNSAFYNIKSSALTNIKSNEAQVDILVWKPFTFTLTDKTNNHDITDCFADMQGFNNDCISKLDFLVSKTDNENIWIWHCRDLLDDIPVISVNASQVRDLLLGRQVRYVGIFKNGQLLLAEFMNFSELVYFDSNKIYPKVLISNL